MKTPANTEALTQQAFAQAPRPAMTREQWHQSLAKQFAPATSRRSMIPESFDFRLSTVRPGLEGEIRTDGLFQLECDRFARARAAFVAALSAPQLHRTQIDRLAADLMQRYAAASAAVYAVCLRALRDDLAEKARDLQQLEARNEQLKEERNRALEESPPIQVALTVPDLNVNVKPSAGVELEYDGHGRVVGTRPRGSDPATKALKKTQAGGSIVP